MLHERPVPHEAEDEGADEDCEHEDENFRENVRLTFGFGNLLDHLLGVDIFFSIPTSNERPPPEWVRK